MISFSKYHGCGNSFVIVDYEQVKQYVLSDLAIHVCSNDTGIGADGCIVVKQKPLEMLFYNQDGTTAPMCGNGIRCFSKYVIDKKLVDTTVFDVITGSGILSVNCEHDLFEVNMGKPLFDKKLLHIESDVNIEEFELHGFKLCSVFMGTVHTVIFVDSFSDMDAEVVGMAICNDDTFKEKTNVNFVEISDQKNMNVITYERGVGITKACGTGCCASFVYANKKGLVDDEVIVHLELGDLHIRYQDDYIMMKGPATFIAEGTLDIKEVRLC
jgi:diaminopimelate epimerase